MFLIRIGAAVLNQTPLAWQHNCDNLQRAIATARDDGVSVLVTPELSISGYGCEDAFESTAVQHTALQLLDELRADTAGMVVTLGLPVYFQNDLYNAVAVVADGEILGFTAKTVLPADGLHYEPRWFRAWSRGAHAEIEIDGRRYPFGSPLYACGGVNIGIEICRDAWVAARSGLDLARRGADVILNPSGSHFAFGKHQIRRRFVLEGSRNFAVAYAYTNLLGNEAGRAIYDGDALIASCGDLLAATPRFSFADRQMTSAVVDIDRCRMLRARSAGMEPDFDAPPLARAPAPAFEWPAIKPLPAAPAPSNEVLSKEEEFTHAVALGLFDYLRKSHSGGFVVSLSGGADSTAAVCLIALMVTLGVGELGSDGFASKLPAIDGLGDGDDAERVRRLLITVYQGTAHSSAATRAAARSVAEAIGARHFEYDVDDLVAGYVAKVEAALGRELTWEDDDTSLQNIQARVRAPGPWLIANIQNALLLSTSNRSEAAVGYTTMDGDTAGGLSPIAGIDKSFLLHWLRWLETDGPQGAGSIHAVAAVNALRPTAELRPPASGQSDEDDLMPYDVLDAMERAAIRDKQSPLEVYRRLQGQFPDADDEQLAGWIERFFQLWSRNQWKRERYAPSFHLDDENLDPKTWCRFPILSGGFEREIDELRAHRADR